MKFISQMIMTGIWEILNIRMMLEQRIRNLSFLVIFVINFCTDLGKLKHLFPMFQHTSPWNISLSLLMPRLGGEGEGGG